MSVVFSYDGIQLFNTGLQLCLEIRVGEKARVAPTPYSQVSTKWVLMPIYLFYQNFPPSPLLFSPTRLLNLKKYSTLPIY